jgi:hypothetical protein
LIVIGPAAGTAQCCGDCDSDGQVTVNELITAVNHALGDCPAEAATPTVTPTPSTTNTAAPTATPVRFVDRGDGTIADLATGLIWEKKIGRDEAVDGFELHDADNRYPWEGQCSNLAAAFCRTDADCPEQHSCVASDQQRTDLTIFRWVEEMNREGTAGFAGFSDWRIPTVEELRVLRASTEAPPMIDPVFEAAQCGTTCVSLRNPACSCTAADLHWTAKEFAPDLARAWRVDFGHGDVLPNLKKDKLRVRAVRGP